MKKIRIKQHAPRDQKGAALVISLILMLALTIVALNSASSTLLQTKMSTAISDRNLALQSAEFAARVGEEQLQAWVQSQNNIINSNSAQKSNQAGTYLHNPNAEVQPWEFGTAKWDGTDSIDAGEILGSKTIQNPRWMLTIYPENPNAQSPLSEGAERGAIPQITGRRYTITAMGWGSSISTRSKIQIEYYSPF